MTRARGSKRHLSRVALIGGQGQDLETFRHLSFPSGAGARSSEKRWDTVVCGLKLIDAIDAVN